MRSWASSTMSSRTREGDLRLDHPELDQVAPRLGPLRPERRAEAVDLAEGHGRGLVVELAALAEVGFLVEVLGFEQGRRALAGARREDGRVHQPEPAAVEEIPDRLDDLGPDLENGVLLRGAEPEMAMLHQERRAVFLEGDGVVLGDLEGFQVLDVELETARRPFLFADPSPDDDRGFLGQGVELPEQRMVFFGAEDRRLDDPRAVPDEEKPHLAARPLVVDPAADLDGLAGMPPDVFDVNPRHNAVIIGKSG